MHKCIYIPTMDISRISFKRLHRLHTDINVRMYASV